jgi:hypothetical protein
VVIQEAGLDGFWLGRVLSKEAWIESYIVEAASIAMPRRHRRAELRISNACTERRRSSDSRNVHLGRQEGPPMHEIIMRPRDKDEGKEYRALGSGNAATRALFR